MNWYYAVGGVQQGPVSTEELQALVKDGRVTTETLVWREGLPNWQAYGSFEAAGGLPPHMPAPPLSPYAPIPNLAPYEALCVECHRIVSKDDAIQSGNVWVCAACKPSFVQKLKEGAVVPELIHEMRFAGFWIRVLARVIDTLILIVVMLPFSLIFGSGLGSQFTPRSNTPAMSEVFGALQWLSIGVNLFYYVWFVGRFGATPGKMALNLKVVTAQGGKVSYMLALGRFFAQILSGCILLIGFLMVAWDSEKRGLHDMICGTRVVYK